MTPEQAAAYVMAQSVACFAEVSGMVAENQSATMRGVSLPYGEEAFQATINSYCVHHNAVMGVYIDSNNR